MPTSIVGWFGNGAIADPDTGRSVFITGWAGVLDYVGSALDRVQSSALLTGGRLSRATYAQNDEVLYGKAQVSKGTFKAAIVNVATTATGIYTLRLGSTTLATLDGYVASDTNNVYIEATGITVASARVDVLSTIMATKNASSTGYADRAQTVALLRTGA